VAAFFLLQTRVQRQEEVVVLQAGRLLVAEWTQAEPARRRQPSAVEVEGPLEVLRAVEIPRPLSGGLPELLRAPSKNTNAAVAGKLAVSVFLPYANYDGGPGTPFSASLLISNEIL